MYRGFLGWQITWCKNFFDRTIFDPYRSPGQNRWSKAYFGIVPVLVRQHVLPILNLSLTPFRLKIFSEFFFHNFFLLLLDHYYTITTRHITPQYITNTTPLHRYYYTTPLHKGLNRWKKVGIHVVEKFEMSLERMKFEIIHVRAKVGKFSTKLEKSWKATIENRKVKKSWKDYAGNNCSMHHSLWLIGVKSKVGSLGSMTHRP